VHRDLVHTGQWSEKLGEDYSWLMKLRAAGDYGGMREHVSEKDAQNSIAAARRILEAVRQARPDLFTDPQPAL
jgi:HEPN domain-containing protein